MPYAPITFVDGQTPLNKTNLDILQGGVIAAERTENKAAANGYASLDAGIKVPVAQLPAAALATYSATPPASPVDGDLWCFPADATNGVMWLFRYRAASASAYKWEFVGGASLRVSGNPNAVMNTLNQVGASGFWMHPASMSFVAPRPGDWDVSGTVEVQANGGAAGVAVVTIANYTTAALIAWNRSNVIPSTSAVVQVSNRYVASVATTDRLCIAVQGSVPGTYKFGAADLFALPVRVS